MRAKTLTLFVIFVMLGCSSGSSSNDATQDGSVDGPGGNASCTTAPCGGDVVGAWTLKDYCAPAGITVPSDTINFNADGTYGLGGPGSTGGGNWSTNGNNLTTGTVTGGYCVVGDTLVTSYGISKGTLIKIRTRVK
jgi:hypothetical protein